MKTKNTIPFKWCNIYLVDGNTNILYITRFTIFGILLDPESPTYISSLFSENASFKEGFPYIMMFIIIITSYVYGKFSKNITKEQDYINQVFKN